MSTDFSFVKPEGWVALKPNFERSEKKLKRRVEKKDFGAEQGERLTKLMKDKYDRWSRGEGKSGKEDVTVMQQREKAPTFHNKSASAFFMERMAYLGRLALEEITSYVLDGTLPNAAVFQQALELNKTSVPEYFKLLSERISDPEFFGKVADGASMMPGAMIRALSQKFGDWGFAAEVKSVVDAARAVDTKRAPQSPAAAPVPAVPGEPVTVDDPVARGPLPDKPGWATVEPQPWPKDIAVPPPSASGPRFRWYVQYTPKDGSGAMRGGVVDGLNEHSVYAFYGELEKKYVVNNFRAIAKEDGSAWKPLPGASTGAPASKPGHSGQNQQEPGRIDKFDVSDPKTYHWDFKFQNQSGHVGEEHVDLTGAQVKQKLRQYARQNLKVIEMINRDAKISASPETAVPGEALTDTAPAAPAAPAKVEAPDTSDPQLYRWHFKVQIGNGPEKDMTEDLTGAQAAACLKEYPPMGIKVLELTKMSIVNQASITINDSDLRFAADGEPEEKFQNGTPIIFKEDVNLKFDALSAHGQIKKNMTGKIKKVEDNDFLIDIAGQMYRLPRLVAEHVMDVFAATVIPSDQQAAQAEGPAAAAPGAAPAAAAAPPAAPPPQAQPPVPKPQPARPAAPAAQAPAAQPVAAVHGTVVVADEQSEDRVVIAYSNVKCRCGHAHDGDVCDDCPCRIFSAADRDRGSIEFCECGDARDKHKSFMWSDVSPGEDECEGACNNVCREFKPKAPEQSLQASFESAGMPRVAGTENPKGGELATFDDLHMILKDSDKNHIKFKDKNDAASKPASNLPHQTAGVKAQGFADLLLLIESGAPGIPSEIGKRLYRADAAVSRVTV